MELSTTAIDAIARRVVELLEHLAAGAREPVALIDGGELARRTGVSRTWIYQHAEALGAIRLGDGPRARLRFHPDAVGRLAVDGTPERPQRPSPPTRPPRTAYPGDVELLPIKTARRALSRLGLLRRRSH
jgi:hypothetical protein